MLTFTIVFIALIGISLIVIQTCSKLFKYLVIGHILKHDISASDVKVFFRSLPFPFTLQIYELWELVLLELYYGRENRAYYNYYALAYLLLIVIAVLLVAPSIFLLIVGLYREYELMILFSAYLIVFILLSLTLYIYYSSKILDYKPKDRVKHQRK